MCSHLAMPHITLVTINITSSYSIQYSLQTYSCTTNIYYIFYLKFHCMYLYNTCMYVRVLGDDGPVKISTYHMTWLPSGNKALTYLLIFQPYTTIHIQVYRLCHNRHIIYPQLHHTSHTGTHAHTHASTYMHSLRYNLLWYVGSGGRAVERQTVSRGDGGSIPPATISKLRQFFPPTFACVFRKRH